MLQMHGNASNPGLVPKGIGCIFDRIKTVCLTPTPMLTNVLTTTPVHCYARLVLCISLLVTSLSFSVISPAIATGVLPPNAEQLKAAHAHVL